MGATLLVLIDVLIEPVAIAEDFWKWEAVQVPLRNYVAWWGIGFLMLQYFHRLPDRPTNPMALPLYLIQFAFFGAFGLLAWIMG